MSNTQTNEQLAAPKEDPGEQARYWLEEIRLGQKSVHRWHERGEKIVRRYRDERDAAQLEVRRFNVLWSNTETLMPVVYAKTPKPEANRRFLDKDPVALVASELLERAVTVSLEHYDFDGMMQACVKDYLLPGRGQAWVRYEAKYDEAGAVAGEKLCCDYVPWQDFLTNAARVWAEVRWCARRSFLSRDELIKRFGDEIGKAVPLDSKPNGVDQNDPQKLDRVAKASVWEIWDKTSGKVWFIHPGYSDRPLNVADAPFKLDGFFPCPRPLTATTANDSTVPTPDYAEYQDQAEELDDLTARIAALQKALKVIGVYDSSVTALQNLLNDGAENVMVPVDGWAGFVAKGGLNGVVAFLPVKEVAETLLQLYTSRKSVKDDLYEITGISDILRGSSEASETATAQQIKSQWGSIRVKDRQKEVARFARDIVRIQSEIIAEVVSPQNMLRWASANELPPEQQQLIPQALQLLRSGPDRGFRIDIETDSTILPDEQSEKRDVTEFLGVLGGFMKEAMPVIQLAPPMIPVMGDILTAVARRFRFGRQLESSIEKAFEELSQMAQQKAQQPPPPNPDMIKAQGQAQADEMRAQSDVLVEQHKAQAHVQIEGMKAQGGLQIAQQKAVGELQLQRAKAHADAVIKANQPQGPVQ